MNGNLSKFDLTTELSIHYIETILKEITQVTETKAITEQIHGTIVTHEIALKVNLRHLPQFYLRSFTLS